MSSVDFFEPLVMHYRLIKNPARLLKNEQSYDVLKSLSDFLMKKYICYRISGETPYGPLIFWFCVSEPKGCLYTKYLRNPRVSPRVLPMLVRIYFGTVKKFFKKFINIFHESSLFWNFFYCFENFLRSDSFSKFDNAFDRQFL